MLLAVLPAAAQNTNDDKNKAIIETTDGSQELNTDEISVIRFNGGKVTVVHSEGETTFDRTLRSLSFQRPNPGTLRLTATTLAEECYSSMFWGCTGLTTAPALPATTLAKSCYFLMFWNCTNLTTAPTLPATTLTNYCYYGMFQYCKKLNSVTCLATDISAEGCTTNWLDGVAATGTFYKPASMNDWTINSVSGIPSGWTVPTLSVTASATLYDPGVALANSTVGYKVCSNGKAYATNAAWPSGESVIGMVAYKNGSSGIVLYKQDNSGTYANANRNSGNPSAANVYVSNLSSKTGKSWTCGTKAQYQNCGVTSSGWSTLQSRLSSAGCTQFTSGGQYWTSTSSNDGKKYYYFSNGNWDMMSKTSLLKVRPLFAF